MEREEKERREEEERRKEQEKRKREEEKKDKESKKKPKDPSPLRTSNLLNIVDEAGEETLEPLP